MVLLCAPRRDRMHDLRLEGPLPPDGGAVGEGHLTDERNGKPPRPRPEPPIRSQFGKMREKLSFIRDTSLQNVWGWGRGVPIPSVITTIIIIIIIIIMIIVTIRRRRRIVISPPLIINPPLIKKNTLGGKHVCLLSI